MNQGSRSRELTWYWRISLTLCWVMTWSWTWFSPKVRITLPTGLPVYWENQTHHFHLVCGKLSSLFLVVAGVTWLIWWLMTLIAWRINMADHLDISPLTVPPVHQVWICLHKKFPLKRIAMSFHLFIWCCQLLISWLKTEPHALFWFLQLV